MSTSTPTNEPQDPMFDWLGDRFLEPEHQFSMRGWRGQPQDVFRRADADTRRVRSWCMREHPERHRLATERSAPLIAETLALACAWDPEFQPVEGASTELATHLLGTHWDADFVVLAKRDPQGPHLVEGGCVCFPSGWAPEEKLRQPVAEVHDPVPGLNEELAPRIDQLLERLPSEGAWERVNWGLSLSGEPNQHPGRKLARPGRDTLPEALWWRVEHQALVRLPRTGGVLFGIRVLSYPLTRVRARKDLAYSLAGQLRSMPESLLRYKGIAPIAEPTALWLKPF